LGKSCGGFGKTTQFYHDHQTPRAALSTLLLLSVSPHHERLRKAEKKSKKKDGFEGKYHHDGAIVGCSTPRRSGRIPTDDRVMAEGLRVAARH
jgi:hypothetical protein